MTYTNTLQFCTTEDDLKKEYYKAARVYHPDAGGDKKAFQQLQRDYDRAFNRLKGIHRKKNGGVYTAETKETAAYYTAVINRIIGIKGIKIEIIGCFLWVTDINGTHKKTLQAAGLKYSRQKNMYYLSPKGYKRVTRHNYDINTIRGMFGSQTISPASRAVLPAH